MDDVRIYYEIIKMCANCRGFERLEGDLFYCKYNSKYIINMVFNEDWYNNNQINDLILLVKNVNQLDWNIIEIGY